MQKIEGSRLYPKIILWGICTLALLGSAIIAYSTVKGPAGTSDSVGYLVSARNLSKGIGMGYYYPDGKFHSLTFHPPGYPILLSLGGLLTKDVVRAARGLDIIFFGLMLFVTGFLILRFSIQPWLAVIACVLLGLFPSAVLLFSSALSESLFMLLYITGMFLLLTYIKNNQRRWFILSVICISLLPVTRLIGIAMVISSSVGLLLFTQGNLAARFRKAALFGTLAIIPISIWLVWLYLQPGSSIAGREFLFTAFADRLRFFRLNIVATTWSWLPFQRIMPQTNYRQHLFLLIAIVLTMVGATFFAIRKIHKDISKAGKDTDLQIFSISLASAISFLLVFLVTYLFTLPTPDIDWRTLSPLYLCALLSSLSAYACWQKAWSQNHWWIKIFPWLLAGVFVYWYYPQSMSIIHYRHDEVSSLTYTWQDSDLVKAVRLLPKNTPIISNKTDIILLWSDRPAYDLLNEMKPGFIEAKTIYGSDSADRAQVAFREKGAALVIFGFDISQEFENIFGWTGRLRAQTIFDGLVIGGKYQNGTIYYYPK